MIAKKENFDEIVEEVSGKIIDGNGLEAASIIVEASIDEVEPTTADELNEEYLEEINDIEKELEKNLDTLGRTVRQLMGKMDDLDQGLTGLKHRIKVIETRIGVIH
jgi:predicted RNase H-like nuclease (RuvC/YqgF family)